MIVLMERQHLNRLCSFDYAGMEEEVWNINSSYTYMSDAHMHVRGIYLPI